MKYSILRQFFLLIVFQFSLIIGQTKRIILSPNGNQLKINNKINLKEAIKTSTFKLKSSESVKHNFANFNPNGIVDSLLYSNRAPFEINFGFFDQNVMMIWFEAPADLTIKAAGFSCSDVSDPTQNPEISIRLMKLNWTKEQLTNIPAPIYSGYYPYSDGLNNSEPFGEHSNNQWLDQTGGIYPLPPWEHAEYDLWSDSGKGYIIEPLMQLSAGNYQWVEMSLIGYEPTLNRGDIFAVVLTHEGTELGSDNRVGFWSDNSIGIPGWKYYAGGRLAADEPGWWVRNYSWDFAVVVDLTGDRGPNIIEHTTLKTTFSTDPRTVEATITDDNPSGGSAGVKSAKIAFSTNEGLTWNETMMSGTEPNFLGELPGFSMGTIKYKIVAEDVNGIETESVTKDYFIFEPSCYKNTLLVFNGFSEPTGYPQSYYFGVGDFSTFRTINLNEDRWSYGPLTEELVNYYQNIIEITTSGPIYNNNDVIKEWLNKSASRFYMLIGDEYLTYQSAGLNQTYTPGSFQHDILGITNIYNDISVNSPGDEKNPSVVLPVENSTLGDALFNEHKQISNDNGWTSPIYYNPVNEIGKDNYLDGFDVREGTEVDIKAIGIDGNTYNIGAHREIDDDTKVVFLSYDALSLSSGDPLQSPQFEYYWYGFSASAPQVQALDWGISFLVWDCFTPDPKIYDITNLGNTISTNSRKIYVTIKDNPCFPNCPDSLVEVNLEYSINGADYISTQMTKVETEKYQGTIPGHPVGTIVSYRIYARDVHGNIGFSRQTIYSYTIFPSSSKKNLVILENYNGNDTLKINECFQDKGEQVDFEYDIYPDSGLIDEQFYSYNNIYNFTSFLEAPQNHFEINDRVGYWLRNYEGKNYFVAGDNFLGPFYAKSTSSYFDHNFEYNTLGVKQSYSSINAIDLYDSTFYYEPTKMFAVDNTMFGEDYYKLSIDDSLFYIDPNINKIDGFKPLDDVIVDFRAVGYDGIEYNIGGHRTLPNGNNVVVMCFDPLSIYFSDSSNSFLDTIATIPAIAKKWFDLTTNVEEDYTKSIPTEYKLFQNYPNPFNPATKIQYNIPVAALSSVEVQHVTLRIYDILGREVITLVNEVKQPGNYEVVFDASSLSSGIYYYQLKSGNFIKTNKMVLLR